MTERDRPTDDPQSRLERLRAHLAKEEQVAREVDDAGNPRPLRQMRLQQRMAWAIAGSLHDVRWWRARPPGDPHERMKIRAAQEARWAAWSFVLDEYLRLYEEETA